MTTSPLAVLQDVFGHPEFRGRQAEVVDHVVAGGDAIVLFPTGAGKSVCYQVPAIARPGVGVIVSPLISLMQDQVVALREKGVRAEILNSTISVSAAKRIAEDLLAGQLELLYVTPERLTMPSFLKMLDRAAISLIAVDEAHCVSQWGHSFRPEYRDLGPLRRRFPGVPWMALTATADEQTRDDIAAALGLEDAPIFATSFDRPNISYTIERRSSDPKAQVLHLLARHPGESGILYCQSRKKVDETVAWLRAQGIAADGYHAGMDQADRDRSQKDFIEGDGKVLVATIAFGMGIDKPDVRFVGHLGLPSSPESYYQESGRAGRDGLPAEAYMYFGLDDIAQRRRMIDKARRGAVTTRVDHAKFSAMIGIAETSGCRRRAILATFGEHTSGGCGNCDRCLNPVKTLDGSTEAGQIIAAIKRGGGKATLHDVVADLVANEPGHDASSWHSMIRQMSADGLVLVDHEAKAALKLTQPAQSPAFDPSEIRFHAQPIVTPSATPRAPRAPKARTTPAVPRAPRPSLGLEDDIFRALSRERSKIARTYKIERFKVVTNATMREMAERRPQNTIELAGVSGIGPAKLERYGERFLEIIRDNTPRVVRQADAGAAGASYDDYDFGDLEDAAPAP